MSTKSIFILVIYFFALIGPSLLAFSIQSKGENGFIAEIGMLAGMTSLMIVFFQFVLSARIKWIDRLYGYNNIIDFHRRMGLVAFGFILLHLSFVTLSTCLSLPWPKNLIILVSVL